MATTIELDDKVAAALRAEADLRGVSLSDFLRDVAISGTAVNRPAELSEEEFERTIDEISDNSGVLPKDFDREDIYFDHD